ncbi:MAG: methionyl-tRNA formyltransferase, partial [Planctomycetes bacterium]|nr:methionyl-tRNA formyltransferase [Planctomycetota bacterium]
MMMGTGQFAVPTFESLLDSRHDVPALFTRPAPPAKGKRPPPRPMFEVAQRRGLPTFEPESVNSPEARGRLRRLDADLFVVCDYGQILSAETLSLARLGGVNLHASLLPKYRGAAPINWALYHGETETGVTVIHMTPRLDAGPALVQRSTPIGPGEDAVALEQRLANFGVPAVHEASEMLAAWDGQSPLGKPQDPSQATRAPRLKKLDGEVDWTRTAEQIKNQHRAFQPWPGLFTHWRRPGHEPLRLILVEIHPVTETAFAAKPGEVAEVSRDHLHIAAGEGLLSLAVVQPAVKRPMPIAEFLR